MAENDAYIYQAQIEEMLKSTRPATTWRDTLRSSLTLKNLYIATSILSFSIMFIFGAMAIRIENRCQIPAPETRCCTCVHLTESQLYGQSMPMMRTLNDVYYGVLMMVNSIFGIGFVVRGIADENKFLLFSMAITQALEIVRGLIDVVLEPPGEESDFIRSVREGLMYTSIALMLISLALVRHVYKLFGWRIFRRGGATRRIRDLYKLFQTYRALNLLDIQSSFMLFLIFVMYLDVVRANGYWVFVVAFVCDVLASRYMVKYLKREDVTGVVVSVVAKLIVMAWWIAVLVVYIVCYKRFATSVGITAPWWIIPRAPDLMSVTETYNGVGCLAERTIHDDRTLEVISFTFAQAALFRIGSIIVGLMVTRKFGSGLRTVFYPKMKDSELSVTPPDDDESIGVTSMTTSERSSRLEESAPPKKDECLIGEFSDEETHEGHQERFIPQSRRRK